MGAACSNIPSRPDSLSCASIADRYNRRFGLKLGIENILITTGSQQALDLISKVLLNTGDGVIVEKPSYLGAIQAFFPNISRYFIRLS